MTNTISYVFIQISIEAIKARFSSKFRSSIASFFFNFFAQGYEAPAGAIKSAYRMHFSPVSFRKTITINLAAIKRF